MKTYQNWDNDDEQRRIKDEKQEQVVGNFLDNNFYPQFTTTITRNHEKTSQLKGLDVTVTSTNQNVYTIDEKAAVQWANRNLRTFALEIDSLNKKGNLYEGWFMHGVHQNEVLNKYWLFVWVDSATTADFTSESEIEQVTVCLVDKRDVYSWLNKKNITKTLLETEAKELREKNKKNDNFNYKFINNIKMTIQTKYKERAINLLMPRQSLVNEIATYSAVVKKNKIEPITRKMGI